MLGFNKAHVFALAAALVSTVSAEAEPLPLFLLPLHQSDATLPQAAQSNDEGTANEDGAAAPERFRRQVVDYQTGETPGTIVIDTPNTYLYLVLGHGRALRYGIGVGREGFTWSGRESISRKAEWPDWTPPDDMIRRQPYLPRVMAGGPGNPLGARAMYLGDTMYRIHGTNQPQTIGGRVSSGCIRMVNHDVIDLYGRVGIGTKVLVLPADRRAESSSKPSLR
jgi:lipoprotein-anchoring transpeptidase ErfK/SrfK